MDFGEMLQWIKQNSKKAYRQGWNGKNQFIYYVPQGSYKPCTKIAEQLVNEQGLVDYAPYIALKTVRKYPFGSSFMQPDLLAKEISIKNPVVIIENDCIIAAGTSLLNAFDRLEVMEYSAKSLVEVSAIGGKIVKISDDEVKEIEVAFNL